MLQCTGRERKARIMHTVIFSRTVSFKTSVLQHSISDRAQFDDELERNLLHTDSSFSFL